MIRQTWRRLAPVTVLALAAATGAAVTVAAPAHAALALGSVTGRVVTAAGAPAANVTVRALGQDSGHSSSASTAADGTYRIADLPVDGYKVLLQSGAGARQYVPQQRREHLAQVYAVREGETTTVDDTLLPQGSLAGRFVDFDGTPLSGARVSIRDLDGASFHFASTNVQGNWRADGVFAGRYQVHFSHGGSISQFAYGKVGVAKPDAITVSADATTTVNDTALARTGMRVTATDALTGAPLTSFRVHVANRSASTDTGELVIDGIQAGTHQATVIAEGYFGVDSQVTLAAGQQAQLGSALEPQSFITVRVVDAVTGDPVPDFCVGAPTLTRAIASERLCGDRTDASGNLRIGWLRPGTYQLFAVRPLMETRPVPDYGAQWVGANGGTGSQLLAQSIRVGRGETVAGPVIRLDRPGVITGQISTSDGQTPRFGQVEVLSGHPREGTSLGVHIGEDGRYTIGFLGPYDWPLLFRADDQARQWSGHVGNRYLARTVRVNAGATTAFDFRFRPAVTVTVKVRGLPSGFDAVHALNAITGDYIGDWAIYSGADEATMLLVGPQLVKLEVYPAEEGSRWVGGDDFLHAQPFWIPSSGSRTITVNF